MSDTEEVHRHDRPEGCSLWAMPLMALVLGLAWMGLVWMAAGFSLGLWVGPLAGAAIAAGPLMAGERRTAGMLITGGSFFSAAALVWLIPLGRQWITVFEWGGAVLILAGFVVVIAGAMRLMRGIGANGAIAGAAGATAALAWLSWPIWMAPLMAEVGRPALDAMVRAHPLLAMNGALLESLPVPWAQQPLAYGLTNLGDDVPYSLPRSAGWCVGVHVVAGILLMLAGSGVDMLRSRRTPLLRGKPAAL